jgi:hypothetical protein
MFKFLHEKLGKEFRHVMETINFVFQTLRVLLLVLCMGESYHLATEKPQASHQPESHINFLPQVAPCGSTQTAYQAAF